MLLKIMKLELGFVGMSLIYLCTLLIIVITVQLSATYIQGKNRSYAWAKENFCSKTDNKKWKKTHRESVNVKMEERIWSMYFSIHIYILTTWSI